ncbi:MAG: SMP-30/gluconolactonase/LRE family protein, partial [Alphaproteobacteria bacterium]
MEPRTIAEGLRFPEGPIAMPDGSVVLVEIERQTLSRVSRDGKVDVIAELGGGPNGAAMGPDGAIYVCNNGGFVFHKEANGDMRPIRQAYDYSGGRIERVDLKTGEVKVLYTHCGDNRLCGPNDIVFDREGGFWFSDLGKSRDRDWDRSGLYYATVDGKHIEEAAFPLITANGVGLSPDEKTVYAAETHTGRLWAFDLEAPGRIRKRAWPSPHGGWLVGNTKGFRNFDSLAVDANGKICVATLMDGGITVIAPDGSSVDHVEMPDPYTTNICFGGPDLKTAFITQSLTGKLIACD